MSDTKTAITQQFMAAAQRTTTLFDLDDQLMALLALMDNAPEDGDWEPSTVTALAEEVEQAISQKVEGYVSVIRTLERMSEARKAESDRLKARAQTAEKNADWLKTQLLTHMQLMGRPRIETAKFTVTIRTNPPAVQVIEPMMVPKQFEKTTITVSVDKRAILEHIKAGGEIPAGCDITRGERLAIS